MLIILPYGLGVSRDCRWSANRREVMNAGRRFMDNILSKSSTLVSVMDENWLIPDIAPFLDDLLQAILQCGLIANVHGKELSSGL